MISFILDPGLIELPAQLAQLCTWGVLKLFRLEVRYII
jgi:hypothetical protein